MNNKILHRGKRIGILVSAGNIEVGITTPSEVPAGLATTAAGTLVQPLNAANNTVDTTAALDGNTTLNNPVPAAGLTGTLTVADDGITQTFTYNTGAGGNASIYAYRVFPTPDDSCATDGSKPPAFV